MYMQSEFIRYFQELNMYLQTQNQQMQEMNQLIQRLVQEVDQLKAKPIQAPTINNEYKFDLLKIERLMGTLNIGIKPDGTNGSIDEFAVDQSMDVKSVEQLYPEIFQGVKQFILHYLDHEAIGILKTCENNYHQVLDDNYRRFILEDIKKQMDQRIRYYLNQVSAEEIDPKKLNQLEEEIMEKVKQDINQTLVAFVKNLPRKGE